MENISLEQMIDELDINAGARLMVSSDITRLWSEYRKHFKDFTPQKLIELLQKKVTDEGTLIFPTYSWEFCQGNGFDYYNTIPRTGGLGRIALGMEGFFRTQHPIYSFAVWGKEANELCAMQNKSAFGNDSPFHYLNEKCVEHLMIGIPFIKGYTFVHYVEELVGVPYRYMKDFTGKYIDADGKESIRTYSMNVRDYDMDMVQIDAVEEYLEPLVRQKKIYYGTEFKLINFAESFPVIKDDIENNRSRNFVTYKGQ